MQWMMGFWRALWGRPRGERGDDASLWILSDIPYLGVPSSRVGFRRTVADESFRTMFLEAFVALWG